MGTPFTEIYNLALVTIRDYKLDKLAVKDYKAFLIHLENLLIRCIPDFHKCLKSLEYEDVEITNPETNEIETIKCFVENLDSLEKSILADSMVVGHFTTNVNDIKYHILHLQSRDFKTFSEAQNLKEQNNYLDKLHERFRQKVKDYGIQHLEELSRM